MKQLLTENNAKNHYFGLSTNFVTDLKNNFFALVEHEFIACLRKDKKQSKIPYSKMRNSLKCDLRNYLAISVSLYTQRHRRKTKKIVKIFLILKKKLERYTLILIRQRHRRKARL
jgi:hypothetical protein